MNVDYLLQQKLICYKDTYRGKKKAAKKAEKEIMRTENAKEREGRKQLSDKGLGRSATGDIVSISETAGSHGYKGATYGSVMSEYDYLDRIRIRIYSFIAFFTKYE